MNERNFSITFLASEPIQIRSDWHITHYRWFGTQFLPVVGLPYITGAVATRSAHGYRAYLGAALVSDEDRDLVYIAEHGTRLDEQSARALFPEIEKWSCK